MKLLKLKTNSGYMMLEPGFEINFLTKTRVNDGKDDDELIELDDGLFYPVETIFIGKNSSGKSTVLKFIKCAIVFLLYGRIPADFLKYRNSLDLEITFYENSNIYRYRGSFFKNSGFGQDPFLHIKEETLERAPYKKTLRKDLTNAVFENVSDFTPSLNADTSRISNVIKREPFHCCGCVDMPPDYFISSIHYFAQNFSNEALSDLIHIFDDSIEYIRFIPNDNPMSTGPGSFLFKRTGEEEIRATYKDIIEWLSDGTFRGVALFANAAISFKHGGHFLIDEIEANFNKNLIENLIILFRDKEVNKAGATLIYTTHYSELLDFTKRSDNINVLHRNGTSISLKNLSEDYENRIELSKSKKFDQNAFDNLTNYKYLNGLRRILLKHDNSRM